MRWIEDLSASGTALLDALFRAHGERCLRRVPGRETLLVGEPAARLVMKRYRGDVWREWWHERVRNVELRSPARRECENLIELGAAGLAVPRALGWCEEATACRLPWSERASRRHGGRSALLMEWVDHRCHLAQLLASGEAPADDWLEPLAGCVARLHDAQWFHRDLYLQHFLPRPASASPSRRPSLVLIDVARARHAQPVPRRWVVKDLAALLHSAPSSVRAALRRRFLGAYLDLREGRARLPAQRSLAREVLAKERRMAAHRPRWVDGEVRA